MNGKANTVVVIAISTSALALLFGVFRRVFFLMLFQAEEQHSQKLELINSSNFGSRPNNLEVPDHEEEPGSQFSVDSLEDGEGRKSSNAFDSEGSKNVPVNDHERRGHNKDRRDRRRPRDVSTHVEGGEEEGNAVVIGMASVDEIVRKKKLFAEAEESDSDSDSDDDESDSNLDDDGDGRSDGSASSRGAFVNKTRTKSSRTHQEEPHENEMNSESRKSRESRDTRGELRKQSSSRRTGGGPGARATIGVLGPIQSDSSDNESDSESSRVHRQQPEAKDKNRGGRGKLRKQTSSRRSGGSGAPGAISILGSIQSDSSANGSDVNTPPASGKLARNASGSPNRKPSHAPANDDVNPPKVKEESQSDRDRDESLTEYDSVVAPTDTNSQTPKSPNVKKSVNSPEHSRSSSSNSSSGRSLRTKSLSSSKSLKNVDDDEDAPVVVLHADSVPWNPEDDLQVGLESIPHDINIVQTSGYSSDDLS